MNVLEAQSISLERGRRPILDQVNVRIESGEFRAVVGPNGSGKSSLLRALAGIWPVQQGNILLDGKAVSKTARQEVARRIAYVPQDTRMDFEFTVHEIVAMGRFPHRGRFRTESSLDRAAISRAVELCAIGSLLPRTVNTLSGGERQRVLIARSLAVEPDFILLDEPTASLDVEHALEILHLCGELARNGHSIFAATHDLNAVARYATGVALLQAGRLVCDGPSEKILNPQTLEQVFGVAIEVLATTSGQPVYVFHRRN